MLAIELVSRNVKTRLIDRLDGPVGWSQAIFIKQRTLSILNQTGIVDQFLEQGQMVREIAFFSEGSRVASYNFDHIDGPYKYILSIPESETIQILTRRFEALGGSVEYGTEFVGLTQHDGFLKLRLRSSDKEMITDASWVVGTDGYHSAVREAIGDAFVGRDYPELWGVVDTQLENWTGQRDTVCAQFEAPLALPFPLGRDRWRVYFRPENTVENALSIIEQKLRAICSDVTLKNPDTPQFFHSHSKLADSFRIGRVFLAGDAAHASNPIEGHGMNAGGQDAHNLGWKLAAAWRGRATEELLDSYEAERRPVDRDVVDSGSKAYYWMTDKTGQKLAHVHTFLSIPGNQELAAIADAEVAWRYPESDIIVDTRALEAPIVGTPMPNNADLWIGDKLASLETIITHQGFTVLLLAVEESPSILVAKIAPALSGLEGVRLVVATRLSEWSGNAPSSTVITDHGGFLHACFNAVRPMLCVIRPDMYISYYSELTAAELRAHFEKMFGVGGG